MITRKLALLAGATALLVACGGGGGGGGGAMTSGGSPPPGSGGAAFVSPLDVAAEAIAVTPPDGQPATRGSLPTAEADTLNPASGGVTVAASDTGDQVPIPASALPAVDTDPEKPNS